ncbi:unnamed protein product [Prunus armeniaca]|uniref:Bidirectional sugar transporter SWEET n=1 Tax=Prunus armeniaca TaxID=36596 RepID=A0A6J5V6S2_PRUAR|nr:hypothetical protein GBA52_020397 [Prunus armeniaca]CAB4283497.1 unnamed protein product [Prunus armeniaca]CAB4313919.1 unnamed protein product [Prunus armeniaca]
MHIPKVFFGVVGNATALFLFLAPIITFKRIIQKRSTEQFSGIPYVMTLLNCLLSAWYGLPFVSPNNILASTINGTGAAIEAIYVLIFIIFAPKREKFKILCLFTFVLAIFSTVALEKLVPSTGNSFECLALILAHVVNGRVGNVEAQEVVHEPLVGYQLQVELLGVLDGLDQRVGWAVLDLLILALEFEGGDRAKPRP